MESVEILFTSAGEPWKIRRQGRVWQVAVQPQRWFERIQWWKDPEYSARKNSGSRIDYAVWRVQVRLGNNPRSEMVTWDLIENPQLDVWGVREYAEQAA
ncbi:hypothetical protein [Glutamicibacter sp. BSL13]